MGANNALKRNKTCLFVYTKIQFLESVGHGRVFVSMVAVPLRVNSLCLNLFMISQNVSTPLVSTELYVMSCH